jgi:predicted transposase YdaD
VTSTPHDDLVRGIFGEPRFMAEELRTVLPSELLATLQLDSLAPVDGSFIDERLRETSADLLFSVGLRGAGSGLVHVLFEHQSTPDERMPLRLLRYQARIWERHSAEHPGDPRLPPIVTVLLFQGPKPWPWPTRFSGALALDDSQRAGFGRHLLDFEFVLDDLARQTDAQILGRASDAIVRLTLLALRNARANSRLFELVATAMSTMRNDLRGREVGPAIARLARYAVNVDEVSIKAVRSAFDNALVPTEWSEAMTTTADYMRAEGHRESLLVQIEVKFGPLDPAIRVRVEDASPEQLIIWIRRIVVVDSLAKVFAD